MATTTNEGLLFFINKMDVLFHRFCISFESIYKSSRAPTPALAMTFTSLQASVWAFWAAINGKRAWLKQSMQTTWLIYINICFEMEKEKRKRNEEKKKRNIAFGASILPAAMALH